MRIIEIDLTWQLFCLCFYFVFFFPPFYWNKSQFLSKQNGLFDQMRKLQLNKWRILIDRFHIKKKYAKYFEQSNVLDGCAVSILLREHAVQIIKENTRNSCWLYSNTLFFSSDNKLARKNMLWKSDNASKIVAQLRILMTALKGVCGQLLYFTVD